MHSARVSWLLWLGLGVVLLLAYGNSFQAGLTLDSRIIIGQDPRLRGWSAENLKLIFTETYWWAFAINDLYRPLTTLSYWVNYTVFGHGDRVAGYHAVNFLLHWTNAWLVFVLIRHVSARVRLAWLAAVIFAVHPVNVESVTNIVGRADLLATVCILGGTWCYLRAGVAAGGARIAWLAALGVLSALGVFAKESGVMVVCFLLLHDWIWRWPGIQGATLGERLRLASREFGPGYVALIPAFILLFLARQAMPTVASVAESRFLDNPIAGASWFQGRMTAVRVLGDYVALLLYPGKLSADYSFNEVPLYGAADHWWHDAVAWIALGFLGWIVWLAVRWRKTAPLFAWGVLLFVVMNLPTSNLLVTIGSIKAERFLYLPSIGFALVAALALHAAAVQLARWKVGEQAVVGPAMTMVLPGVIVGALALRTHVRNIDWRDELSLWASAVRASPDSYKVWKGYSAALWKEGKPEGTLDLAITLAERGQDIVERARLPAGRAGSDLPLHLGYLYRLKGEAFGRRGRQDEAQQWYAKALAQLQRAEERDRELNRRLRAARIAANPGTPAPELGDHRIYLELGLIHIHQERWRELAAAAFAKQKYAPADSMGYSMAGVAHARVNQVEPAVVYFLAAMLLNPADPEIMENLRKCYLALGMNPSPVRMENGNITADGSNPVVRGHMTEANTLLVRNHDAAGLRAAAERLRARAIRDFQVPAGLLAPAAGAR